MNVNSQKETTSFYSKVLKLKSWENTTNKFSNNPWWKRNSNESKHVEIDSDKKFSNPRKKSQCIYQFTYQDSFIKQNKFTISILLIIMIINQTSFLMNLLIRSINFAIKFALLTIWEKMRLKFIVKLIKMQDSWLNPTFDITFVQRKSSLLKD